MSPAELRLVEFIAARLESLLERPEAWGPLSSVEDQVLQLLELRRFLLDPSLTTQDTRKLTRDYLNFIDEVIEDATNEPLAIQLKRRNRESELTEILREFSNRELATLVASGALDEPVIERSRAVELATRLIEQLTASTRQRMLRSKPRHEAIEFAQETRD